MDIEQIKSLFDAAEMLPIKPSFEDFPVYVSTDVIDEDKSVKWNRQEIKKRIDARNNEIERLKSIKHSALKDAHSQALQFVCEKTGMSLQQASILWNFVISSVQHNPNGLTFWQQLAQQIDLYNSLNNSTSS